MGDAQHVLAVDTSSRLLSVAIRKGEKEVLELNLAGTPRHSEQLIALMGQGLKELRLKKNELDRLIWGVGPGSFTGLRIGLSILKGLHAGLGVRALGASSLDVIAFGSGIVNGDLFVCVDAKRDSIYLAKYRFQNGVPVKKTEDALVSCDELIEQLSPGVTLTGDALQVYGGTIRERFGDGVSFMADSFWYPRAVFLIQMLDAQSKWLKPLTPRTMTPEYLRRSEAEEKAQMTAGRKTK